MRKETACGDEQKSIETERGKEKKSDILRKSAAIGAPLHNDCNDCTQRRPRPTPDETRRERDGKKNRPPGKQTERVREMTDVSSDVRQKSEKTKSKIREREREKKPPAVDK